MIHCQLKRAGTLTLVCTLVSSQLLDDPHSRLWLSMSGSDWNLRHKYKRLKR
jgi:hypothetical protein